MQENVRPGSAKSAHELYVYLRNSVNAHGKRVYGCDRKCRLDMSYTLPSRVHHTGKSPSHLRAPPCECTVGQMRLLRFRWKLFCCVGNWISNGNWKFATETCTFTVYWYCVLLVTDFCCWVFSLAVVYFFLLLVVFFHCCQRKVIVVDKELSLSTKSCCQKKVLVAFKWQLWAIVDFEGKVYESTAIIMTMHWNSAVYDVTFRSRSIINLCTLAWPKTWMLRLTVTQCTHDKVCNLAINKSKKI